MTYNNCVEADADRVQQKALRAALNTWDRALRRDECGSWCISGERGSIHTWGDGKTWAVYSACRSAQHWTWTKKRLSFCTLTQDGDDEGVLRLLQLPTPEQADVIRDILGIQKRREVSPEVLVRLKAFAFERKPRSEGTLEQIIGLDERPTPDAHPDQVPILDAQPVK